MNYRRYTVVKKVEVYSNVYILGIKPNTTWDNEDEGGDISILPITDLVGSNTIEFSSLKGRKHSLEAKKFNQYSLPRKVRQFSIINKEDVTTYYIIKIKEEENNA